MTEYRTTMRMKYKEARESRKAAWMAIFAAGMLIGILWMNVLPVFGAEEQAPEKIIAHGGGSYQGYETTNSLEALNHSIDSGCKEIELDMELSADGRIVMIHDWDRTTMHYYGRTFSGRLSQKQFLQLSVYDRLTVLNMEKLAQVLKKQDDVRIVTDAKEDNRKVLAAIKDQYPELQDRFIPQIYDYSEWEPVRDLGYQDIILTLYAMPDPDMDEVAAFAKEHRISAVTMPDYMADKGYCSQLAAQGIRVYVHPLSGYEDAVRYMKLGAYGVYSGTLLPEEFSGLEADHYLTAVKSDGTVVKLQDSRLTDWKEFRIYGLKPGETARYYLDQSKKPADEAAFEDLKPGKHKLTILIEKGNQQLGTLDYFLWKEESGLRVLHKKYEYRLDAVKQEHDFGTVMEENRFSEEVRKVLSESFIAKQGEASYYTEGERKNYYNGDELMEARKGSYGKTILPLADTMKNLGAESVTMDQAKGITVLYQGERSYVMAETGIVRCDATVSRMNSRVVLYLNKAMAGGEFYRLITGRNCAEGDGILIILPEGSTPNKASERKLLEAARKLF